MLLLIIIEEKGQKKKKKTRKNNILEDLVYENHLLVIYMASYLAVISSEGCDCKVLYHYCSY